jgi:hypothetical protein
VAARRSVEAIVAIPAATRVEGRSVAVNFSRRGKELFTIFMADFFLKNCLDGQEVLAVEVFELLLISY